MNLAERLDRKIALLQELDRLGVPPSHIHRIEAVKDEIGRRGCTKSHIAAVQLAKSHQFPHACILEDDFVLQVSPEMFHQQVNEALKNDFDVLFLGMTPISLSRVGGSLHRVHTALAMPAFIVSHNYYDKLIHIYQQALTENIAHDLVTQRYQPKDRWYGFWPPLSRQRAGFSDIEKRHVDYAYLDVQGSMLRPERPLSFINTPYGRIYRHQE